MTSDDEKPEEIFWEAEVLWEAEAESPLSTSTLLITPSPTPSSTAMTFGIVRRLPQVEFVESILITVAVVLTIILIFAAVYFYLIRKLGYFSDNPIYKRRTNYDSAQYQMVPSQRQNASDFFNDERRPRPSTLRLTRTASSAGDLRVVSLPKTDDKQSLRKQPVVTAGKEPTRAEPEDSTVGSSVQTSRADSVPRNPPPAQLPRKRIELPGRTNNGELLITASSSAPSTTTASDNSFFTARSVYFTPTQGDWSIDVPLYRSSRDWRYSSLAPVAGPPRITITSASNAFVAPVGRV